MKPTIIVAGLGRCDGDAMDALIRVDLQAL